MLADLNSLSFKTTARYKRDNEVCSHPITVTKTDLIVSPLSSSYVAALTDTSPMDLISQKVTMQTYSPTRLLSQPISIKAKDLGAKQSLLMREA